MTSPISSEPFQINGETFAVGDRIEVRHVDEGVTLLDPGIFAGTLDVGLGIGILIDLEVTNETVVILAKDLKSIRRLPATGAVPMITTADRILARSRRRLRRRSLGSIQSDHSRDIAETGTTTYPDPDTDRLYRQAFDLHVRLQRRIEELVRSGG